MKFVTLFALILSFSSICKGASDSRLIDATVSYSHGGNARCISGMTRVAFTTDIIRLNYVGPKDQMDLTQLFQELRWINSTVVQDMLAGNLQIDGSYEIYAKLCVPIRSTSKRLKTVQVLTHGGTLDHTYWDMAQGYSYVDAHAKAGYATLSYDRLGVGLSDHPDPLQIVQANVHVDVLHDLIQLLRGGIEGYTFEKIIGVGHSLGAWYTQGTATRYPLDFDALVLTGTSAYFDIAPVVHSAMQVQIANTDPSGRFKDLPNGYLVQAPILSAHQFNLYYYPHFDPGVLLSQHSKRQTLSLGELLTVPTLMRPSTWSGPLDIVNGVNDFVYCAGNCLHGGDQTAKVARVFFPQVGDNFSSFNLPNCGHNLPGHHNAQDAYEHMFDFFRQNELMPETETSEQEEEDHSEL